MAAIIQPPPPTTPKRAPDSYDYVNEARLVYQRRQSANGRADGAKNRCKQVPLLLVHIELRGSGVVFVLISQLVHALDGNKDK
jgi:hypothetical protein